MHLIYSIFFCISLYAQFSWVATVLAGSILNEFGSHKQKVEKHCVKQKQICQVFGSYTRVEIMSKFPTK